MNPLHPDHDLLQAYLDGELAADALQTLEARLIREPALADALMRLAQEEAVIREWVQTKSEPLAEPARPTPRRWRHLVTGLTVLTAAVAVIAMILIPGKHSSPLAGPVLATLEEVQGEVQVVSADGATEPAESGQPLYAGQEVQTGAEDSSTVLRIHDSRLVLSSDTRIRLGHDDSLPDLIPLLYVSEGIVNAEVLRKPVVLRSDFAELRGKEGKFSFVSLPEATFIETDDGLGRLTRKTDGRSIDVTRGQFAVVNASDPLHSQPLPTRFTQPRRTLAVGSGPVHGLFFDPAGEALVTATRDTLRRWNLHSLKAESTLFSLPKKRSLRSFSPSADGKRFAFATEERFARVIDGGSGADLWLRKGTRRAAAVALSPDGRIVAGSWSGKEGHSVYLHDIALGLERTLHTGHSGAVTALAWSPRGNLLATAGPDRSIRVWKTDDLQRIHIVLKLPVDVRSLAFSPDEQWLAAGDRKGLIRLLDLATGSERLLTGHVREIQDLTFSPDGRMLASASGDGTTRVWSVADGQELATFKKHATAVTSVAFAHDGRTLATGGQDRKVHFWDPPIIEIRP